MKKIPKTNFGKSREKGDPMVLREFWRNADSWDAVVAPQVENPEKKVITLIEAVKEMVDTINYYSGHSGKVTCNERCEFVGDEFVSDDSATPLSHKRASIQYGAGSEMYGLNYRYSSDDFWEMFILSKILEGYSLAEGEKVRHEIK